MVTLSVRTSLFLALCFGSVFSNAQVALSNLERDLKSSYCIAVLQKETAAEDLKHEILKQSGIDIGHPAYKELLQSSELRKQSLHRLRSYLIPRVKNSDVDGLQLARHRGEEDWNLFLTCSKCMSSQQREKCLAECDKSLGGPRLRMDSCKSPDFLPF
jgi:hypothetical protein